MRRSSVLIIAAVSCILFAAAAIRLSPRFSSAEAAQAQTAQAASTDAPPAAKVTPVSTTTTKPATLPTELYTAHRGESIAAIARQYLSKTIYLTRSELADAIRSTNNKSGNILKAGEQITIPGILPAPIVEHTIPVAKDFEVRAVYLTGMMAGSDHGLRIIRHWREVGGNAIVFDIKDSDGTVAIPFEHPLLGKHPVYIHDLPKFVHFLHSENMHAIARLAIFRDERLVTEHPELAVQSRRTGQAWRENGKLVWTDPSNPKVQDYNIALAKFVAQSGADEIQFDYVRFPAEGDQKDATFAFQKDHGAADAPSADAAGAATSPCGDGRLGRPAEAKQDGTSADAEALCNNHVNPNAAATAPNAVVIPNAARAARGTVHHSAQPLPTKGSPQTPHLAMQRSDVITAFLKKAYAELHPTGVLFSLDVFGVMAWQRPVDLSHTGQDIVNMAKYCDVLSPMIYPSHFFGMDNIPHPGDAPEHFISESMDRFELITKGSGVVIRPWLQAFHWRTKTYSPEYIKIQVATAREKGGVGFLFWNAANDYSKPFLAMPEMHEADAKGAKDNPKYFRGDELPASAVRASLEPAK